MLLSDLLNGQMPSANVRPNSRFTKKGPGIEPGRATSNSKRKANRRKLRSAKQHYGTFG